MEDISRKKVTNEVESRRRKMFEGLCGLGKKANSYWFSYLKEMTF